MTNFLINLNFSDEILADTIDTFYQQQQLSAILTTSMSTMLAKQNVQLPYFCQLTTDNWQKNVELDIYLTDANEGRQLNHDARGKDYATNILSYPSDLPIEVLTILPSIPLGELVICHQVVEKQAKEQNKSISDHLTHLLVHGILHLLGFDHELSEVERIEMESFEIEILSKLDIANPYICL